MARRRNPQPTRHTVAIVGDGQTERIYFADIRDTDRPKNLAIFPEQPARIGNFKGVLDRAISLIERYDDVYALIDMDKVIQDHQQGAYNQLKAAAIEAGVQVLENNPCFEIWILLHFENTGRLFNDCDEVSRRIRSRYIHDYEKSQRYLVAARLYNSFKEDIPTHAIPNANLLEVDRQYQDERFPRAEIFRFFEWYFNN